MKRETRDRELWCLECSELGSGCSLLGCGQAALQQDLDGGALLGENQRVPQLLLLHVT
jgi:hypothetical protein